MKSPAIRAATFTGLLGLLLGTAFGMSMMRLHVPWLNLDRFDRQLDRYDPEFLKQFDLSNLQVPRRQLLRGGPEKDAIPSLTMPKTLSVAEIDLDSPDPNDIYAFRPNDRIISVDVNGEVRAYPLRLLNWHEVVNDELGGTPIAVIYCPLCDSVSVVDRRVNGETLTFGITGLLYQSNVIMYDREHHGLWSQILPQAVSGPYAGKSLRHYPWTITTLEQWRRSHPDGTIVALDPEHGRDYSFNPYAGYLASEFLLFEVRHKDDRLEEKDRVIGVRFGDIVRAYPLKAVHASPERRLTDRVAGERIVIEADPDTGHVAVIDFPDQAQIIHTFWFSWASTHPDTEIYRR